jgi:hypothetical protein
MVTIVLTEEQAQWLHGALTDMTDLLEPEDIPEDIRGFIVDILQQLEPGGA